MTIIQFRISVTISGKWEAMYQQQCKPEMEYFMASQSERISPVQCPPYLPCPGKVERDMMNGRSFGRTDLRAAFVTIVSVNPYMLWRL